MRRLFLIVCTAVIITGIFWIFNEADQDLAQSRGPERSSISKKPVAPSIEKAKPRLNEALPKTDAPSLSFPRSLAQDEVPLPSLP